MGKVSMPTPQIGHFTEEDYEHIYEPAEDSFILLDALEEDAEVIRELKPLVCLEIGSGSGVVTSFLSALLDNVPSLLLCTDINEKACLATQRTAAANKVQIEGVRCDLLYPLLARLRGKIDTLIFNPPYVPTDEDELQSTQVARGIGGAWAGGSLGMAITNVVLDLLPTLLSPGGRFYLVAIDQNRPLEIIERMKGMGMSGRTVLKRRAGRELLSVLCFTHAS